MYILYRKLFFEIGELQERDAEKEQSKHKIKQKKSRQKTK